MAEMAVLLQGLEVGLDFQGKVVAGFAEKCKVLDAAYHHDRCRNLKAVFEAAFHHGWMDLAGLEVLLEILEILLESLEAVDRMRMAAWLLELPKAMEAVEQRGKVHQKSMVIGVGMPGGQLQS
jgi:hypothetical protein